MKKILSLILALTMVLALAACGGETSAETTAPVSGGEPSPVTPDPNAWKYSVRGIDVQMHASAAPVLEALGEPVSYTEEASCAFTGLDKTYYYGGFYLQTYPLGEEDYIYSLWLVDDSSSTPEGIYIGSSKADVEAAYGTEGFNGSNAYILTSTTATLTIILDGDTVTSIQYDAIVE